MEDRRGKMTTAEQPKPSLASLATPHPMFKSQNDVLAPVFGDLIRENFENPIRAWVEDLNERNMGA